MKITTPFPQGVAKRLRQGQVGESSSWQNQREAINTASSLPQMLKGGTG